MPPAGSRVERRPRDPSCLYFESSDLKQGRQSKRRGPVLITALRDPGEGSIPIDKIGMNTLNGVESVPHRSHIDGLSFRVIELALRFIDTVSFGREIRETEYDGIMDRKESGPGSEFRGNPDPLPER